MKKLTALLCALSLLFLLCACDSPAAPTEPATTATTGPVSTEDPTEDQPPVPQETQPEEASSDVPTYPGTTIPLDGLYLQEVARHDQPIFDTPSYDGAVVDTVQVAGIYTIVEEVTDDEGNLWGKLKSGTGWIDLDDARAFNENIPLLSAGYAHEDLLNTGDYIGCGEDSEFSVALVIHAYDTATDLKLTQVLWTEEGFVDDTVLFTLEELTPRTPLVAKVVFSGDMTMFAVTATAPDGTVQRYILSQNGRNNGLTVTLDTPDTP